MNTKSNSKAINVSAPVNFGTLYSMSVEIRIRERGKLEDSAHIFIKNPEMTLKDVQK